MMERESEISDMRILVIEDEEKLAALMQRRLTEEGYTADVRADGVGGLAQFEAAKYDLVVLDLMLPRMSGSDVLARIRRANSNVPVLVLTSRDTVGDKVKLFEAGADDYVTKPFAFAELLARVKSLLRRGPVTRASVLRVADLELDLSTKRVRRGERNIELTAKEYSLLEYLMRNPGHVLSRNMIIDHVWDHTFDNISNIVDVYVRHLRTKIDETQARKLIHTVRGTGYMIRDETTP